MTKNNKQQHRIRRPCNERRQKKTTKDGKFSIVSCQTNGIKSAEMQVQLPNNDKIYPTQLGKQKLKLVAR